MNYTTKYTPTGSKAAPGAAVGGKVVDENDNASTGSGVIWRPFVNGNLKNFQQMSALCVSAVLNDMQSSHTYTVTFKPEVEGTFKLTCDGAPGWSEHEWVINADIDQGETEWGEVIKETNELVKENNAMLKELVGE